jgi:hypothetical protein
LEPIAEKKRSPKVKLVQFQGSRSHALLRRAELEALLQMPDYKTERPCDGCNRTCDCARHSTSCACVCTPTCERARTLLSSEPGNYPIEIGVLPLVFELHSLRLTKPCWSCEGHADGKRHAHRAPRVWFYSAAGVYAELLARHLEALTFAGRLKARWSVSLCPHGEDASVTTFALGPVEPHDMPLAIYQADARVIAENLGQHMREEAKSMLAALDRD